MGILSNRDAIGSRIVFHSGTRSLSQQVKGGGSYLSANDRRQIFAVREGESDLSVEIRWPNGNRVEITGLEAGRRYTVIEPNSAEASPRLYPEG